MLPITSRRSEDGIQNLPNGGDKLSPPSNSDGRGETD